VKIRILGILIFGFSTVINAQVKIRLFTSRLPESAVFSVTKGVYDLRLSDGSVHPLPADEPVIIMKMGSKIVVKLRDRSSVICDTLTFVARSDSDLYSLRINGRNPVKQYYCGELKCYPDLGALLFINKCDIEKYIAGVVQAEGGTGHNIEFFKTQAIIARTYLYKNINKHTVDGYNVCDDIHCQVFNGLPSDQLLIKAAIETRGLVILDRNNFLITAAFHSNCGGETSSASDVWLSGSDYLKSIKDPYCTESRSAAWSKSIPGSVWLSCMAKLGYNGPTDLSVFNFEQKSRLLYYKTGSFSIPLKTLRSDLSLRSTFFSVNANGDSIILSGKGYGHGVGLCQEGAIKMASKGYRYKDIISFYYSGVIISDIKNAVALQ
jgi:stage II sporulation protein D